MQDRMSDGLARVRARFVEELVNRHARLVVLRAWLDDASAYGPALTETGQICHKIAGTAATLGFPTLGTQAGAIDDLITKSQQATETAAPDLRDQIDRLISTMDDVIQPG